MLKSNSQLTEPRFKRHLQNTHWENKKPALRFVVKLHHAHILHFDFRLEIFGRLFSFEFDDLHKCFEHPIRVLLRPDHDLAGLLTERRIIPSDHEADPIIVWDHGTYSSPVGSRENILDQLQKGCLEVDLRGIRLNGRFRIKRSKQHWSLECLSIKSLPPKTMQSVLSGRHLYQTFSTPSSSPTPFCLWLEWSDYFTDQSSSPQVVVHKGQVVDLNIAAMANSISLGMNIQHILPLVQNCQVKEFRSDPDRQHAWLKHLVPFTDVIQPVAENSAVVDLGKHPDPNYVAGKLLTRLNSKPFGNLHYGAGPSKWIAQLASRQNNPYGFVEKTQQRIACQPTENLFCIPLDDRKRLRVLGFETIGAINGVDQSKIASQFGERASLICAAASGKPIEPVLPLFPPKAVIETDLFESPINDSISLQKSLHSLALKLTEKIAGQQAGLTILIAELEDGSQRTVRRSYNRPLHTPDRIQASLDYLAAELQKTCPDIVRLTAQLDRLEPHKSSQQDLFVAASRTDSQTALDSLKTAIGSKSIVLASEIEISRREQVLKSWRDATGWS